MKVVQLLAATSMIAAALSIIMTAAWLVRQRAAHHDGLLIGRRDLSALEQRAKGKVAAKARKMA